MLSTNGKNNLKYFQLSITESKQVYNFQDLIDYLTPSYPAKTNIDREGGRCYLLPKHSIETFGCYDEWNSCFNDCSVFNFI